MDDDVGRSSAGIIMRLVMIAWPSLVGENAQGLISSLYSFFSFCYSKTKLRNDLICRNDVLGSSWKLLFKLRWPELINTVEPPADWQHLYWEKHLQKYDMTPIDLFFFFSF